VRKRISGGTQPLVIVGFLGVKATENLAARPRSGGNRGQ